MYYSFRPERCGRIGENSEIDWDATPPEVEYPHYEFRMPLEDDIFVSTPIYGVTETFKEVLESSDLTGYELGGEMETSKAPQFEERDPEAKIPPCYWLRITGKAGVDDFGFNDDPDDTRLFVSAKALQVMKQNVQLDHADVKEQE